MNPFDSCVFSLSSVFSRNSFVMSVANSCFDVFLTMRRLNAVCARPPPPPPIIFFRVSLATLWYSFIPLRGKKFCLAQELITNDTIHASSPRLAALTIRPLCGFQNLKKCHQFLSCPTHSIWASNPSNLGLVLFVLLS